MLIPEKGLVQPVMCGEGTTGGEATPHFLPGFHSSANQRPWNPGLLYTEGSPSGEHHREAVWLRPSSNGGDHHLGPRHSFQLFSGSFVSWSTSGQSDESMGQIRGKYLHWAVTGTYLPSVQGDIGEC